MANEPINKPKSSKFIQFIRCNFLNLLLTIILMVVLGLLARNINEKYQHNAKIAASIGQNVIYNIKEGKIVNTFKTPKPSTTVASKASPFDAAKNQAKPKPEPDDNLPKIAVLVSDVGLSSAITALALQLPPKVTIGVSPYASDLDILAKKLLEAQHELMINIPLEPIHYPEDDAGPYALLTTLDHADNLERLKYLVGKLPAIVGVYTMNGEKFTNNATAITPIIKFLNEHNIIYAYAGLKNNVAISQVANAEKFNLVITDYTIDETITDEFIASQLAKAISKAKKDGFATIVCHPYPMSIKALAAWLDSLAANKVSLARFGDIVNLMNKEKANAINAAPAKPAIP
jgi:polysaccharide deacetylase 2 family uncharacterized protein YibQ